MMTEILVKPVNLQRSTTLAVAERYHTNLPIEHIVNIRDIVNHTLAGIRLTEFLPTNDPKFESWQLSLVELLSNETSS